MFSLAEATRTSFKGTAYICSQALCSLVINKHGFMKLWQFIASVTEQRARNRKPFCSPLKAFNAISSEFLCSSCQENILARSDLLGRPNEMLDLSGVMGSSRQAILALGKSFPPWIHGTGSRQLIFKEIKQSLWMALSISNTHRLKSISAQPFGLPGPCWGKRNCLGLHLWRWLRK